MFSWLTRFLGFGKGVKARYDAAQTTSQNTRHWANADALSAVTANTHGVRVTLRNRARYEYANNPYCNGMIKTVAYHTIGTGPTVQVYDASGNSPGISQQVERQWRKWARSVGLASKLITARQAKCRDGEVFLLLTTNQAIPGPVKLDFQVIEADRVYSPYGIAPQLNHIDGIDYDISGNPVKYHIHAHPGEGISPLMVDKPQEVDAQFVIHLFGEDRPGQRRGIPEVTPSLPLFATLRRYTQATLSAAETAANIAAYMKTTALPQEIAPHNPFELMSIEQNTVMTLPEGYEIQQLKPEQPTTNYDMFTRALIKEIARCLHLPYNVAAGDSSSYNYASGKLDYQNFDRAIEIERDHLERMALDRIFNEWKNEAALAGVIPQVPLDSEFSHEWRWPAPRSIDAQTDATANEIALRSGQLSLPTLYARMGQDAETEQAKMANGLGLTLDEYRLLVAQSLFSNGNPLNQPGQSQPQDQGAAANG